MIRLLMKPPKMAPIDSLDSDLRCYYAHSMKIYNTPREDRELEFIRKIFQNVICPNSDIGDTSKGMRTYLKIVKWAEIVIASEYKGHIGGGVYAEVSRALFSKIPVYCLRGGEFYPVTDAKVVDRQDPKIRYAKLVIQE